MKLHFEADLGYQLQAIDAVCDLFKGQKSGQYSPFTVVMAREAQPSLPGAEAQAGTG